MIIMNFIKYSAVSYLVVIGVYYVWLIYGGIILGLWSSFLFWFSWGINILSLFAIASIFYNFISIRIYVWQATLLIMILTESYNLYITGLFIKEAGTVSNILILAKYLFLVAPPFLALFYLSFFKSTGRRDES